MPNHKSEHSVWIFFIMRAQLMILDLTFTSLEKKVLMLQTIVVESQYFQVGVPDLQSRCVL